MAKKLSEPIFKRMFYRILICMKCNCKLRGSIEDVKAGKIKCRKCGSVQLRPKAKTRRGANK